MAPASDPVPRSSFQTTSGRGLDWTSLPMRLWQKAKRLGIWDPQAIDFSEDRRHWEALSDHDRDGILRITSLFQAGEEAVTLDLVPLILVVSEEGRLEEEMYLTSFLWEEAKHVEAFYRFSHEVVQQQQDFTPYHGPCYRKIFYDELPRALGRLRHDRSPVAQAEAAVTYNLIVEGVLAETGYQAYFDAIRRYGVMPGLQKMIGLLKQDESRHVAYGVYLLSRLVAEHGERVWDAIERRLGELFEPAMGVVSELFEAYGDHVPLGLQMDTFVDYALNQFQNNRIQQIERARHQSLADLVPDLSLGEG